MSRRRGAGSGTDSVKILEGLVKINSVNPYEERGDGEAELAEHIRQLLAAMGLKARLRKVREKRSNVIGVLGGGLRGRRLMLNGHIDTVGVGGMTIDPFGAKIDSQGLLHGRGACDMKGSIASMLAAIGTIADSGEELDGELTFTGVVDEEYESIGTRAVVKEMSSDAAIVGEPTSLAVGLAHKGFVWAEVDAKGVAAHGSVPEKGVDAIAQMGRLLSLLPSLQRRYAKSKHPLLGSPKCHASTIRGGVEWSIVPESCTLRLERRTLPGEDGSTFVEELQGLVDEVRRTDGTFNATVRNVFEQAPLEIGRDAPVVKQIASSHRRVMGRTPRYIGLPYWTDAAVLSEAGIPSCLFGPGDISLAHSADEYVPVSEVVTGTSIFADIVRGFCGARSR